MKMIQLNVCGYFAKLPWDVSTHYSGLLVGGYDYTTVVIRIIKIKSVLPVTITCDKVKINHLACIQNVFFFYSVFLALEGDDC